MMTHHICCVRIQCRSGYLVKDVELLFFAHVSEQNILNDVYLAVYALHLALYQLFSFTSIYDMQMLLIVMVKK